MILLGCREHITLNEAAVKLGIGYRAVLAYIDNHPDIPRQRIGRQIFICFADLYEHPKYISGREKVTV